MSYQILQNGKETVSVLQLRLKMLSSAYEQKWYFITDMW